MSEPKQESEPVEAKNSDTPSIKDPYTAVKNVGQLEADALVILSHTHRRLQGPRHRPEALSDAVVRKWQAEPQ